MRSAYQAAVRPVLGASGEWKRLVEEWHDWNATMLPEIKESFTDSFDGGERADHFDAKAPDQKPDNPDSPDN